MGLFEQKTAIVTGAASGIGKALGEALARRGAITVMADVQDKMLEEAVESITGAGYRAEAATLDVTDFEAVQRLIRDTVSRYGRLDYLFNNAGIAVGAEARDCSLDDWHNVLNVNLFGVVNGVHAAYPLMVQQGAGHIINTASIEGLIPFPGAGSYVASKYAVVGLSNVLRIEGADLGVKVSVVCPGYVKTPIFRTCKLIKIDREKMLKTLPERFGVTPEECALAILRGVKKNKAVIVVTGFAKVLWFVHRINTRLIPWKMRKDLRKSRKVLRIEDGCDLF
jgi:NAD(P)-dependent dehydrogenase (short-subunit alcohol dehydrogenase family)